MCCVHMFMYVCICYLCWYHVHLKNALCMVSCIHVYLCTCTPVVYIYTYVLLCSILAMLVACVLEECIVYGVMYIYVHVHQWCIYFKTVGVHSVIYVYTA